MERRTKTRNTRNEVLSVLCHFARISRVHTVACLQLHMSLLFAMGKKKFIFDQGLMRRHLLKCLENKLMEEFPVRKERRNSDKAINHDAVMVHALFM